jgi:murein DD-endopeptidase MepM/ murein hydrolase activator NlpD
VRFTEASPSLFYVFSYRPELPQETFDAFLASLRFHNDEESFVAPLSRLQERSILKPFGIFITAETSPVRPERFSGYHTGTDFEVFEEERTQPVSVLALCGGKLRSKKQAEGYGGVAVQECLLGNEPITVIYGHLALSRVEVNIGAYLAPGDVVGKLGEQGPDTDGERKHLHLGIHHGQDVLLAGYVDHEEALKDWMDPLPLLKEE